MSHVLRIENWFPDLIWEYGRRWGLLGKGEQSSKRSWKLWLWSKVCRTDSDIEMLTILLVNSAFLRLPNHFSLWILENFSDLSFEQMICLYHQIPKYDTVLGIPQPFLWEVNTTQSIMQTNFHTKEPHMEKS